MEAWLGPLPQRGGHVPRRSLACLGWSEKYGVGGSCSEPEPRVLSRYCGGGGLIKDKGLATRICHPETYVCLACHLVLFK